MFSQIQHELPEVAGRAACLIDPFDVGSIRTGLRRVVCDPGYRRTLIAAGFQNVKRFAPEIIAAKYAAAYHQIATGVANGSL